VTVLHAVESMPCLPSESSLELRRGYSGLIRIFLNWRRPGERVRRLSRQAHAENQQPA